MPTIIDLKQDLKKLADPKRAKVSAWFFKTKPGQYGHGDIFIGLTVPQQRQVARQYPDLSLADVKQLLKDKIHEFRLVGLLILVDQFNHADAANQKAIYTFYLKNVTRVNNWDLVDLSAPNIVGQYLLNKNRAVLYSLAKSKNLWARRVSIVATYAFIKQGQLTDTFKLAKLLFTDNHDLIHKATGWMLREAGKKNQKALEKFLNRQAIQMPRTALRYAIERLPENKRLFYLKKRS